MFFQARLVIPPSTTQQEKVTAVLPVEPGMVRHIWVGFPQGCAELAHLQVFYHGWQVWPRPTDTSFAWNNFVYDFDDRYPVTAEPYEFTLRGWNEDDSYPHRIMFACIIDETPEEQEIIEVSQVLIDLGLMEME